MAHIFIRHTPFHNREGGSRLTKLETARIRILMHQIAQMLIIHDDFSILPQSATDLQESPDGLRPLLLYRRKWNTMQFVRLQPGDGLGLDAIEAMMHHEADRYHELKRQNAVHNLYGLTFFIFTQWRSDENMRQISTLAQYHGMTRNIGAAAAAIDLARGVLGPMPIGNVAKDLSMEPIRELIEKFPNEEYPEALLSRTAGEWEAYLFELASRRQERMAKAFRPEKKTVATYAILAITIGIWLAVTAYPREILSAMLLVPELIRQGEWYRLLSPVLLHYEFMHIAFNMMSLYVFGRYVERIFGTGRFLLIYWLSGLAGSLASFAWTENSALGASGAIFGLFGALLAFGRYDRKTFAMTIGSAIYGMVAINLIIGFILPKVGYMGHIGGLVGGYLVGLAIGVPGYERKRTLSYAAGYAALVAVTFWLGMR
jgi:rhomboid protease GluP